MFQDKEIFAPEAFIFPAIRPGRCWWFSGYFLGMFTRLKISKADGTYIKELQKLQKVNLLILDDFGLQAFDNNTREILMDIIEDRYDKSSTIISSQIPVSVWYDIIGEGTIADAVLDRIVNSSHRIDLKGESLRKGFLNNNN